MKAAAEAAVAKVGESLALLAAINIVLHVSELTAAIASRATVNQITAQTMERTAAIAERATVKDAAIPSHAMESEMDRGDR